MTLPNALTPLTEQAHWLVWKLEKNGKGKPTKVPYQPTGEKASSIDPKTWVNYETAVRTPNYDGIGFTLLRSGLAAFDIDDCRDPETGAVEPWAMALVKRANSYAEITPSGTGLRIIGYGEGEKVHRQEAIEIFSLAPSFLGSVASHLKRDNRWGIIHDDGQLTVTLDDQSIAGSLTRTRLVPG